METDDLFRFAHQLADHAAQETLSRFRTGTAVTNKKDGGFDPVTEGDREAEKALRSLIEEHLPNNGIKGEEFDEKPSRDGVRWVLDPIDGTRAFICGVPVWTTLIGREDSGVPSFGVIDQPYLKERWIGSVIGGEKRLETSSGLAACSSGQTSLNQAKLMVTDMRDGEYLNTDEAARIARLADQCQLTRQGLDSYGFGLVASGQMDLVVEAGLHWHDIAAVIPVIEAAGGVVTDWQGQPLRDTGGTLQTVIAATAELADAARAALAR